MISTPETNTLTEMLLSGYRLDGRVLTEYREINFRFPNGIGFATTGCCVVKIGATSVMAQVSTEIVEPKPFRPSQGMLFVNFDANILKLIKPVHRKRDDEGRRLSTVLQSLLRDCIDLDALCIVAWERVFAVRVELRALSYDGNLGDCGALAAIAALAAFRRPDVYVDDNGKVIVDVDSKYRPKVPLVIRRIPVLVTLGLNSDAKVILVDPSAREEAILTGGRVMLGMTGFSEVCCCYTTGLTAPIHSSALSRCVRLGNSRAQNLVALVNRVLDGLRIQRETNLAAAHARSSELNHLLKSTQFPPLVLSSFSFLSNDLITSDKAGVVEREEGELLMEDMKVLIDSDKDMDIETPEEEDTDGEESPFQSKVKPVTKLLPYGVIEVPSTSALTEHSHSLESLSDSNAFWRTVVPDVGDDGNVDNLSKDKLAEFNINVVSESIKKGKKRKKSGKRIFDANDEDEPSVTILQLN